MQGYLFDLDEFDLPDEGGTASPSPYCGPPPLTLADGRDYQYEWRHRVRMGWLRGQSRLVGVAATGIGKSFGAALFLRDVLDGLLDAFGRQRRGIFISHRGLLVEQAARELRILLPNERIEIEMGDYRARTDADIVVACVDSLTIPRRLKWFRKDRYAACVWDESHNYGKRNPKVRRILDHFGEEMRHIGLTATPDRSDALSVFEDVIFEYDVWQAVDQGYLVKPFMAYEFSGDIKLEQVKLNANGDFDSDDLADLMSGARPVAAVVSAARKWARYNGGQRPTIITCASVRHAEICAMLLNEWQKKDGGGMAAPIHSGLDSKVVDQTLRDFKAGLVQYLTHFDCLTEGFDSPLPKVLVNGRPMKARWKFGQMAGRTLRPEGCVARLLAKEDDPAVRRGMIAQSGKPGAMIVDVAGTGHRLSCDMLDVFRPGTPEDEELATSVRGRAMDRAFKGLPTDPLRDYQELRKERDEARRVRLLARQVEDQERFRDILVSAPLLTKMEDPFAKAVNVGREPPWLTGKRPTLKMKTALIKAGIPRESVESYTFFQAKRAMNVMVKRIEAGLSSYKQLGLLRKYGIDATMMSFEEASDEINKLAKSGWRRP